MSPVAPERDNLNNAPEIVEDIARALKEEFSVSILERYLAGTRACIVKFRSEVVRASAVESAIWYLYDKMHRATVGRWAAQGGFSGGGAAIRREDVLSVELVLPVRNKVRGSPRQLRFERVD